MGYREYRRIKRRKRRRAVMKTLGETLVATVIGILMTTAILYAWLTEPMPEYQEPMVEVGNNYEIPMSQVDEFNRQRDAYKEAEAKEEAAFYEAVLQSSDYQEDGE